MVLFLPSYKTDNGKAGTLFCEFLGSLAGEQMWVQGPKCMLREPARTLEVAVWCMDLPAGSFLRSTPALARGLALG